MSGRDQERIGCSPLILRSGAPIFVEVDHSDDYKEGEVMGSAALLG